MRGRARCPHRAAILIQRNSRLNVIMSHPSTAPSTAFHGRPNPKPPRRHRQPPRPRIRHSFTFHPPPRGTKGTSQRRDKGIPNAAAPVQPLTLTGKCLRILQPLLQPLRLIRTARLVPAIGPAHLLLPLGSFPRTVWIKRCICRDRREGQSNSILPTVGQRRSYNF